MELQKMVIYLNGIKKLFYENYKCLYILHDSYSLSKK